MWSCVPPSRRPLGRAAGTAVHPTLPSQRVAGVFAVLCSATSIYLAWRFVQYQSVNGSNGFSWTKDETVFNNHPLYMVTAFCSAICGVLSFRAPLPVATVKSCLPMYDDDGDASPEAAKKLAKPLHIFFHVGAVVFASIGISAVFVEHAMGSPKYANLGTVHTWIGLSAYILMAAQAATGLVVFATSWCSQKFKQAWRPRHVVLGEVVIVAFESALASGVVQLATDLCSYEPKGIDWNPANHYDDVSHACMVARWLGWFCFFAAICVLYAVIPLPGRRPSSPPDGTPSAPPSGGFDPTPEAVPEEE
mmetsp:Transcript_22942/g.90978  ORF Transcript_22942/g.90978 Transcript_22942/m.90978 type:complete len:306 (-) Transcript_22942:63-980(-)